MSLRAIGGKLIKHGANLVRHARGRPQGKPQSRTISSSAKPSIQGPIGKSDWLKNNRYHVFRNIGVQVSQRARRVLIDDVLNRVTSKFYTGEVHKASRRGLYGNTAPLLGLVGCAVVGQGLISKDEELEGICWEIRECMTKIQQNREYKDESQNTPIGNAVNLANFTFGEPIAKGSNAVVYSVASTQNSPTEDTKPSKFPLALKMMFNYDIQSNSLAILKAMYRETVPAASYYNNQGITSYELEFLNRTRHLPPHPNIVKILSVFTDYVPELEKCKEMYPAALPKRIDPDGEGRNMSLFILMNRYHQNMQEFLAGPEKPTSRYSVLLLAQLLEGIVHMVNHNIAHRDLKADNILLDLSDQRAPLAVISDFGCCLAEKSSSLKVPYVSFDVEKGGNTALMAPEIISAQPGPFSKLNYSKSDLWAAGALAYEIFGAPNPFYGNRSTRLSSASYKDEDLPELPESVPPICRRLVQSMLKRNPHQRISVEMAANVCQLFLWAPSSWLEKGTGKSASFADILEWLLNLAAKTLCEGGKQGEAEFWQGRALSQAEYRLISTFMCRVKLQSIKDALAWIQEV